MAEEELRGGVANPGAVVRVGETVRRPRGPNTASASQLLRHLEAVGFDATPRFFGIDDKGRETLSYIPGDVPLPVFPDWSMTDEVLVELAVLMRRFHDATASFDVRAAGAWSDELIDPAGGDVVCHNDVCPENVVFRDRRPVALLDFDFAAPGRRVWDVAMAIGMWAPLRDPAARTAHPPGLDALHRAVVFVRAYGLDHFTADEFIAAVDEAKRVGSRFVRRHVEAGDPGFVEMVGASGGEERYRLNKAWWVEHRPRLRESLS
jgi:hypothetical protein